MGLARIEVWVHDHLLKNEAVRHFLYSIYQRVLWAVSPKVVSEGKLTQLTPNDEYEYIGGYYDKCPLLGENLLTLRVKKATKEADSTDEAEIVLINTKTNTVSVIATTSTWNVQQGCMLQWLDADMILYNDFRNRQYVGIIRKLSNNQETVLEMPVYAVAPDKTFALSLDFSRLHRLRPGYGYANLPETTEAEKCPDKPCIWKIDLISGKAEPLLRYTDFNHFEHRSEMDDAEHKVNHLMISPNGKRFMVLHRWFQGKTKFTRLVTCNIDGTDMFNLSDDDYVSHCWWKDDETIISYLNKNGMGKAYYEMKDHTNDYTHKWSQLVMDGHPSCSPDGTLTVTDTYPDRKRVQSVYVMNGSSVQRVARVFSPFRYGGDVRCDLHPRWNDDGKQVIIDASFSGKRGIYSIDVSDEHERAVKGIGEKPLPVGKSVSVIVPCYNTGSIIEETFDSLEQQTTHDFEVIFVNDGSTDDTLQRLQNYKKRAKCRVKIIDKKNEGVSVARNTALREATGEYILFLDSDDIYHPECIQQMAFAVKTNQTDAVFCRVSRKLGEVLQLEQIPEAVTISMKDAMDKLLFQMGKYSFTCYLYNRAVLLQHNIEFDVDTKYGEDREFNWKYMCHCQTIAWIDAPLYGYRVNRASATNTANWRKTDLLKAVKRTEDYLEKMGCPYVAKFKDYFYARATWTVAKTFAVVGDKELFRRFLSEYPSKQYMKRTLRDKGKAVSFFSALYLINPWLFYIMMKTIGLIKR